jgi:hypothetical protein
MENDKPPFVAIIGGFYKLTSDDAKAEAKNTAAELGAALAGAGMGLVVYCHAARNWETWRITSRLLHLNGRLSTGTVFN